MSVKKVAWVVVGLMVAALPVAATDTVDTPTVAEQIAGLQQMCADTEQARAQRQADTSLYERLGGYDRIHEFTLEVVRLHNQNPAIQSMFVDVDGDRLAKDVADFVASGTGGPPAHAYTGRDMPSSHRDLHLTDADFLSAGGDIVTAMKTTGYGQNEIDEMLCILVSLKDQVVFQ